MPGLLWKGKKMKTDNIEQQLRDYYRDLKDQPSQTVVSDDIDDNLIARYIEGTATPEEIEKIESQANTNDKLKLLLQILTSQNPVEIPQLPISSVKRQISNFFCLSHPTSISFLRCAACFVIIVTGSIFIIGKLKLSSNTSKPQITLRGGTSSTNIYQLPITNKNDKADF